MEEWRLIAQEAYQFHIPVKAGVLPYLEQCSQKGQEMALFTASVPALAMPAIKRLGLDSYITTFIFAQELGLEKRNPDSFLRAAEILKISPSDCTMFDDAPHNCAAARAAGMKVVGVYDRFYESAQEQVRENSDRYIKSFEELLKI